MKKLFLFTTFLSLLSLTACNSRNTSSTAPSSPEKESSISVSEEESTLEEESSNSQMYGYSVTVLKPDQSPCQGVSVVWCTSQNCFRPVAVNTQGKATFSSEAESLFVHLDNLPSGYAYNPNEYLCTYDNLDVTITLSSVEDFSNGITKPGVYSANIEEKDIPLELTLDLPEGNYHVESWVDYTLASAEFDVNPRVEFGEASDDDSGSGDNFALDFSIDASKVNVLNIFANKTSKFYFVISQK